MTDTKNDIATVAAPSVGVEPAADTSTACGCSRRSALRVAGVAGAAVVGAGSLAACGAEEAVSSATSAAASVASSAASAAGDAIAASTVPVGGGTVLESLKVVVTQPTDGDFKAFSAVCPHQGCLVDAVADGTINCPCHGSKFDIATGEVKAGPATTGLTAKAVSVTADGITVS